LGDQYRYSVWLINGSEVPKRIFEDHAYIRPRSIYSMTGTRGVDCTIKDLTWGAETITVNHSMDRRLNDRMGDAQLSISLAFRG